MSDYIRCKNSRSIDMLLAAKYHYTVPTLEGRERAIVVQEVIAIHNGLEKISKSDAIHVMMSEFGEILFRNPHVVKLMVSDMLRFNSFPWPENNPALFVDVLFDGLVSALSQTFVTDLAQARIPVWENGKPPLDPNVTAELIRRLSPKREAA